jgi:hypothetical protein
MTDADAFAGLAPEERARLDAFGRAFERVGVPEYSTFTEVVPSDRLGEAQQRALDVLGTGARRRAVRAAMERFVDYATQAYSSRPTLTDTFLMFRSVPDRADDRLRFLATVERAVVAVVLWDELDELDRAVLLGPWGRFIDAGAA